MLEPLRMFGEYNRVSAFGGPDRPQVHRQVKYGVEHLLSRDLNNTGSLWWIETDNTFHWISATEFNPRYRSWLLRNTEAFGIRRPHRGYLSVISPFVTVDSAVTAKTMYYWDNRLVAGGGVKLTPPLMGGLVGISRLAAYVDCLRVLSYYRQAAPQSIPKYEIDFGVSFSVSHWYR